ncbi:hypothetical protein VCRA2133O404_470001 [Vibrio crassostreae]|nr:hypothetical protein VCRA2133O403_430001 [Vibrio crassostreae]CAK3052835.1 hypothetical protein VCRA2133O401_450021 [Vibrio crassostreae]CAK3973230.1 hypothetical protein VCRA2133O404_470001 [Vibrio crassostreae]CAK3983909.1 hypothetical protein VCRA2133O402_450021 [Vibrio crassostreae]
MGWRDDLILRAERLECGVHDTLTYKHGNNPSIKLHGLPLLSYEPIAIII